MNGVFILAIGCAWFSAVVALTKKRSIVGWSLVGFLFPIVGSVVVACLRSKEPIDPLMARWDLQRLDYNGRPSR